LFEKLRKIFQALGPGILFAAAAIGASHIVQSTRAGASYGFYLLIFVILSNFFKYPFFEYGHRYTASKNESIIAGYRHLGNWAIYIFIFLNIFTSVISSAGVTIVTAAISALLLKLFFNIDIQILYLSIIILLSIFVLLWFGKYSLMDKVIKILIAILAISTTIAFFIAMTTGMQIADDFIEPEILSLTTFSFLIALMGWMPAPIEASTWSSVWAMENNKLNNKPMNLKDALIDFKVGYIGTAVLACFFLGLGAFVMYGTGEVFSDNAVIFTGQIIDLYTKNLGNWSKPIISVVALITMASTTITVIDAYPRTLSEAIRVLKKESQASDKIYWVLFFIISGIAVIIISFFATKIKDMIDFATVISFVAAPIFAFLNYKLVISKFMPKESQPSKLLKVISIIGIIFLSTFTIAFLYTFFI
jgi:Mn2+/Fe2+ NRAMP family transporter